MAKVKTTDGLRGLSSFPISGDVEAFDAMEATRACFEDIGTLLEVQPCSMKAITWASDGKTWAVVKARLYRDSMGMYVDLTRRSGDGLLFLHVYSEMDDALGPVRLKHGGNLLCDQSSGNPNLYGYWPLADILRFEDEHLTVWEKVRSGQISSQDFQEHVSQVPYQIRSRALGYASLRKLRTCELLDEILSEAHAYWACRD